METKYSDKITKSYERWVAAINEEPSEQYDPNYKKWRAKQYRRAKIFEEICVKEGLKYMDVYQDLLDSRRMLVNKY